jgi:MtN3 and saliva related transmembrane protein
MEEIKLEKIEDKSTRFTKMYAKYMLVMGILGQSLFYVQALKIFISCSAKDVSFLGFLFGFISVTSWGIYGILIKDRVLVVANIVAMVGAVLVLIGIMIHG